MPETPDESTDRAHDPEAAENGPGVAGVTPVSDHDGDEDAGEIEDDDEVSEEDQEDSAATRRPPWHFKVMLVATVIYLGYRSYQGITWLIHHA
jgi:hypothetical protein